MRIPLAPTLPPRAVLEPKRPGFAFRPGPEVDRFRSRTRVAYFSMEIAVRPEMHTYAGGLGILAGDIARTCADVELPLVFVTLLSRSGYFRQLIDASGQQTESSDRWDPERWCVPLESRIDLEIDGRTVWVRPWLAVITGARRFEVPVLLLDTDLDANVPDDRRLTDALYGGDAAYRLTQEIVLGIGGFRLLEALGFEPNKYHLNEGHAALLTLELLRRARTAPEERAAGAPEYRLEDVRRRCVFTTHTPVQAGHDRFDYRLVERLLPREFDLGAVKDLAGSDHLDLTLLALKLAGYVNGVSRRHAETTRTMYPGFRVHSVTNGVHVGTWTHPAFARLYDARLPGWRSDPSLLVRALQFSNEDVGAAHRQAKQDLLDRIRRASGISLNPEVLTLGFARRMVGYKRPLLLFEDTGRLAALGARYPIQVILAGKAHPNDGEGKEEIRRIHDAARRLKDQVTCVFLPNYEMEWAKSLVAGCDLWLNTPAPPMEASGTSGMKAALNGGLNLSVLDGWWVEGCLEGVTGWSIPHRVAGGGDGADAAGLYDRLERDVLPCFYEEPERWRSMMRQAIGYLGSYVHSHRMMLPYATEAYLA